MRGSQRLLNIQIAKCFALCPAPFAFQGPSHLNCYISVDVRVLAATNQNLSTAVAAGAFRQDLYYRLNVFPIQVPPLRERIADIGLLLEYFIGRYAARVGRKFTHLANGTLELFKAYEWPGNIRELQNVVERAVTLCEGNIFAVDESWLRSDALAPSVPTGPLAALAEREREMIEAALARCQGRVSGPSGAAALLKVPRQTLESKIASFGINKQRYRI
jgi:formate hydrogenlyase transcriptional activator